MVAQERDGKWACLNLKMMSQSRQPKPAPVGSETNKQHILAKGVFAQGDALEKWRQKLATLRSTLFNGRDTPWLLMRPSWGTLEYRR